MALTDVKDGSKEGFVKRVASTFSMRKKNKNPTSSSPNFLPRSKSTGSSTNYESMKLVPSKKVSDVTRIKSSACVLPRREKIDDRGGGDGTNKKFVKWRSFDDCDSIWSSSDCASPTSLVEEHRLSVSFRFSVDESVVSWLSKLAKSSLSLNLQETSSLKDRCKIPKNNKDNAKENIPKKSSKEEDSSTQSSLEKKVSFSPKLDTNKSSLVHEKNPEIVNISKVDEPLFWPYEQRFDWTPEDILKHFSMSPRRKKLLNAKMSSCSSPRSMRAQLLQTRKVELKDVCCKRKLVFNGSVTNTSKTPELKRTISNNIKNEPIKNCVKRNKSLPSRLRKTSKTCSKVVPIIEAAGEEVIVVTARKLINRRSKTMLEDDFALMNNDISIENAVGLCEFQGREGLLDSEFNSETFLFDDNTL